ncbi:MAG: sigma-70 family RNA polymerase sigma factor [Nanoarchaeota archaeon]|nr:sigma-70 family RNA polymerase sigma factor [Nanoarchaeota archaeon]
MTERKYDDVLHRYFTEIQKPDYIELPNKKRIALLDKSRSGDTGAKKLLINSMQRQVFSIAIKYQENGLTRMDLIQAGNEGLMDAIEKYEEGKNTQFKTYAEYRIRGAILDSIRFDSRKGFVYLTKNTFPNILPTTGDKDSPKNELNLALRNIPVNEGKGPLEELFKEELPTIIRKEIQKKFNQDPRARKILELILEDHNLREIGEIMGCTESRISQLYIKYRKTLSKSERLREEFKQL